MSSSQPLDEDGIRKYVERLWPLLRSITGDGVRETHQILSELMPLETHEIPSGTQVFDWTVPDEWYCRSAFIVTPSGDKICDISEHNLHIVNYSEGFSGTLSLEELKDHIYSLPNQPDAIPYVTSYYKRRWGFCMRHQDLIKLAPGNYEVYIDAGHKGPSDGGSLTYSDFVLLPTGCEDSSCSAADVGMKNEILISTYTCHPSMGNNELSGPLVTALLYQKLRALDRRRFTYRFVFVPETIGAIAYLSKHGEHLRKHLQAGFVVTCAGDPAPFVLKKSRRGNTVADRAAEALLVSTYPQASFSVKDFFPTGSDERQYCSIGFDLPVASITRSMYGLYPEYHTSLDDMHFITPLAMLESASVYCSICEAIENNYTYVNMLPYCEPQLGKRGLYPTVGANKDREKQVDAILWMLSMSDGEKDLLDVSFKSGIPPSILAIVAQKLEKGGILQKKKKEKP